MFGESKYFLEARPNEDQVSGTVLLLCDFGCVLDASALLTMGTAASVQTSVDIGKGGLDIGRDCELWLHPWGGSVVILSEDFGGTAPDTGTTDIAGQLQGGK